MFLNKLNINVWKCFFCFIITFFFNSLAFPQEQLLEDAGFELSNAVGTFPSAGYWKNSDAGGGADASCTTTATHSGSNGLWIYTGSEDWAGWSGPYQEFSSSVGKVYSASAWIRTPSIGEGGRWINGSKACVRIVFLNSSKSELSIKESSGVTTINSPWYSNLVKSDPAPIGTAYVRFICYIEKPPGISGQSIANFDDCSFENIPKPATPTFSLSPGTYTSAQDVSINCETSGATIHYTTDGSDPTESSSTYSNSLNIASTMTLKARAYKSNWDPSGIASVIYVFNNKYNGICYGPFRDNEDPGYGIQPTREELKEDLYFISKLSSSIRTYGITDSLSFIPELCQEVGLNCYPGALISSNSCENDREIQSVIEVASQNFSCIKGLIIGNEVLLRNDRSESELIEYINRVKESTEYPVSTAETWKVWIDHPQLVKNVDFLLVHIHPYWDSLSVDHAANHVVEKWELLKTHYPGKTIIVGETGWPTNGEEVGEAIPSPENQQKFVSDFLSLANENSIQHFYFEVFDEKWKERFEGSVGNHWGLYYSNGSLKPLLEDLVPDEAQEGIDRPARKIKVIPVTLPLPVYIDGCSPENAFYPSGWMGDLDGWAGNTIDILDENCTESPYSGESCVRITYIPGDKGWGGIYWQYPKNNWGDYPGYAISKEANLTFWARGMEGGEKVEFISGGISTPGKPHSDSFGPVTTGVVDLTDEWKLYSIDLSGQNLSMAIGGFSWTTNSFQNPGGFTIYLDDIQFEPLIKPPSGVEGNNASEFRVSAPYPNPFNSETSISYNLLELSHVTMTIYNILGLKIKKLVNEENPPGTYVVKWDGTDDSGDNVTSGIYFFKLETNKGYVKTAKMMFLK
ncbi:chitobiase/beta-hexosaminidase C-terminal domain-containing protein [Candidatus Latescibacterota bacterium]